MTYTKDIILPASKSIGARYLVASFFAGTLSEAARFNDSDDLMVIRDALDILNEPKGFAVDVDIHASGTAFRFITAVASTIAGGIFIIGGTPRLCSRPMAPMLEVLGQAGASVKSIGKGDNRGKGPYIVEGRRLKGGDFSIRGDVSSQFVSALMLVAPMWEKGMRLRFTSPLVSRPYVEMTVSVMRSFGITVTLSESEVTVAPGKYRAPERFVVEADWSAAGFFYEAAAIRPMQIKIKDLVSPSVSLQGDARTAEFFRKLGVCSIFRDDLAVIEQTGERPGFVEADLTDNPDLAPAFAVACVMSKCRFRFTGVRNLRLKECDRLSALQQEFKRLGYAIDVEDDAIGWTGESWSVDTPVTIETYDDHRIAMAFAMAALWEGRIRIRHPEVVEKSFAAFWDELPKIGLLCYREGDAMEVSGSGYASHKIYGGKERDI